MNKRPNHLGRKLPRRNLDLIPAQNTTERKREFQRASAVTQQNHFALWRLNSGETTDTPRHERAGFNAGRPGVTIKLFDEV